MAFLVRLPLDGEGLCTLEVDVARPYGTSLPRRREVTTAVVDTGSVATLLRADIAERLRLGRTGFTLISGVADREPILCATSLADIVLHGDGGRIWTLEMPLVVVAREDGPGLVLGMDSLAEGELRVHLPHRAWEFRVPPSP